MTTAFPQSKTTVPIAFGAMTIGEAGNEQSRIHDEATVQAILDCLKKHGVDEIDVSITSRLKKTLRTDERYSLPECTAVEQAKHF
jgi:hypothetical protein